MKSYQRLLFLGLAITVLTFYGCGSDSNTTPPGGGGYTNAINLSGGVSAVGDGGTGNQVGIDAPGNLALAKAGTVDASFTMPAFTPDYGAVPYTVSTDLTVELDGDSSVGGLCTESASFMDTSLYITDNDNICANGIKVTGLLVEAGATLTLPEATSEGGPVNLARYELSNDLVVYGTIRTVNDSRHLSFNLIGSGSIYVGATGIITTVPVAAGAMGGELRLYTHNGGDVFILGSVLAGGSAPGGSAGPGSNDGIEIYVDYNETGSGNLYVSGAIRNDGADNPAGAGGRAAEINLISSNSMYFSDTAIISAQGGSGVGGQGGSGDYIDLRPGRDRAGSAEFVAAGQFLTNGGSATNADAGDASWFYVYSYGASPSNIRVNAVFDASGGTATGAGYRGGAGDSVEFYTENNGQIDVAGSIDASGGDGSAGAGYAGYLFMGQYGTGSGDILLNGFDAIITSGGTGGANGGFGNVINLSADGTVTCDIDLITTGGDAGLVGGGAGSISINSGVRPSVVSGTYDVSGGVGGSANGTDGTYTVDP